MATACFTGLPDCTSALTFLRKASLLALFTKGMSLPLFSRFGRLLERLVGGRACRAGLPHLLAGAFFDALAFSMNITVKTRFRSHLSAPSSRLRLVAVDTLAMSPVPPGRSSIHG